MHKNFLEQKHSRLQSKRIYWIFGTINVEKPNPKHIILKLYKQEEKILKASRENHEIICKGILSNWLQASDKQNSGKWS